MKFPNWVLLSVVVGAIGIGLLVQSAAFSGMQQFGYEDALLFGLFNTSTALGVGGFVLAVLIVMRSRKALMFSDEVVTELMQVTWPTRDETLRASTTVILTTFFTAAVLAFYDFIWKNLADVFFFSEESVLQKLALFFNLT